MHRAGKYKLFYRAAILTAMLLMYTQGLHAQGSSGLEELAIVPAGIDDVLYQSLNRQREELDRQREALSSEKENFNADCSSVSSEDEDKLVSCQQRAGEIKDKISDYKNALAEYDQAVEEARKTAVPQILTPGEAPVVDLRDIAVENGLSDDPDGLRMALLGDFHQAVKERTAEPNQQVETIIKSIENYQAPPTTKEITDLRAGDVILIGPDPSTLKDSMQSYTIQFLDRFSSNKWDSPASHTVIFIREYKGKRYFLDHTLGEGSAIIDEQTFMQRYGHRETQVASLAASPLKPEEGERLWRVSRELAKNSRNPGFHLIDKSNFGIYGGENMVCAEAARWVLVQAGREIPITESWIKKNIGRVRYGPADFYLNNQYFLITPLGLPKPRPEEPKGVEPYKVDQGESTYKGQGLNP